jgi:site-specific DNA recombinase
MGAVGLGVELWVELDKPEFLNAITADEHNARRDAIAKSLDGIEKKRGELAALWATPGGLSDTEWKQARNTLAENEQELRRELAEVPPPVINVDITAARAAWPDMMIDEKREFLRLFVTKVTVHSARPGHPRVFDPERLEVEWRIV